MSRHGVNLSSQSTEVVSSLVSDERQAIPPSTSSIVSQWQDLASTDRRSQDFLPSLASLTTEDNRSSTVNLRGADARVVLTVMDEVFRGGGISRENDSNALITMRRLAYNSGQIPTRYQVDRPSLKVEGAIIASGAFADVRKGELGDKVVAVRTIRIDRKKNSDESKRLFCKECIIWMSLSHPNLLHLIGVNIDPQTGQCSTISDMMSGNIWEYIHKNTVNRHHLLKEAAAGLWHLHQRGIIHGDLKGHNILITKDEPPRACLADFGLSTLTPLTPGTTTTITSGGTPLYMAPELLVPTKFGNLDARPTKSADIYAFGMVIFEVLTGLQPFYEKKWTAYELIFHVAGGGRPTKPGNAEQVGFRGETWELVESCWVENPTGRPTIGKVHTHLTNVASVSTTIGPTANKHTPEANSSKGMQLFKTILSKHEVSSTNSTITGHSVTVSTTTTTSLLRTISTRFSTLFARRKRTSHSLHLSLGNLRSSASVRHSCNSLRTDRQTILSKWEALDSVESINCLQAQLVLLVDVEEIRNIALKFNGKEAAVVINSIAKVLGRVEGLETTKLHALKVLRKLAGDTRQVPESYLVDRKARYTTQDTIIASGGFADIREGRLGKNVVAVKTIRTSQKANVDAIHKAFCKESVLWMNVAHPNILKLIAVDIDLRSKKFSMISEMKNGDIMEYIHAQRADRLSLLRDVANGLGYLHELGIVHGDLKGSNILINDRTPPQACISDFGFCAIAPWMPFDPSTHKDTGGTWDYMAPELFQQDAKCTTEADMFAFGTAVYEVVTGAQVFGGRRKVRAPLSPSARRKPERPSDPAAGGFGQGTWEFMEGCWEENPGRRPTAGEAVKHFERVAETSKPVDRSPAPLIQRTDSETDSELDDSRSQTSSVLGPQASTSTINYNCTLCF